MSSWPERKFQASSISITGKLGKAFTALRNHNATVIRFKCPVPWKKDHFSCNLFRFSSHRQQLLKKSTTSWSMIHDFSLILPKEFTSRNLPNVYNMETFSISFCFPLSLSAFCLWLQTDFWQMTLHIVIIMLNFKFIVFGGFGCKQQTRNPMY